MMPAMARRMIHRMTKLAARSSLRAAVVLGTCVACGYAAGLALVVFTLSQIDTRRPQPGFLLFLERILYSRYGDLDPRNTGDCSLLLSTGDRIVVSHPYSFLLIILGSGIVILLLLLAAALGGMLVAYHGTRVFIPMSLRNTPAAETDRVRALWRRALRISMPRARVLALLGLGLGFSGAWVGMISSALACRLHEEIDWRWNATPLPPWSPRPVLGPFAWVDGFWVIGGTWLAPILLAALPARRRLRHSPELIARWCPSCGYPNHASPSASPAPVTAPAPPHRCPECGAQLPIPDHEPANPCRRVREDGKGWFTLEEDAE
jgi:hypothetical protein